MVKKCKREMSKNDELSALTAMKRIIKNEEKIGELVEAAIEEQVGTDDDDDGEVDDSSIKQGGFQLKRVTTMYFYFKVTESGVL